MRTNQLKDYKERKEEWTVKELFEMVIDLFYQIAEEYNLVVSHELYENSILFAHEDKQMLLDRTLVGGFTMTDLTTCELVRVRESIEPQEFINLCRYDINYWLREIRKHKVFYLNMKGE